MFDVITFGAATQDIYFKSKNFLSLRGEKFKGGQGVCFNLGSKIEAQEIFFSSGGGGTNSAATFARQGLKTAFCGQLGTDCFGDSILGELKSLKINASLVCRTKEKATNVSVILMSPGQEDRAILVYRGASDCLVKKDIPWDKLKGAKLFYLAPFSGKLAELTEELIDFAKKNSIQVAFNPGYGQLIFPQDKIKKILQKIDILILNQEEASLITKIPFIQEKEIFRKLDEWVKGICIMTRGDRGVMVSDGQYLYEAPAIKTNVTDTTGAGDAFGAGFAAELLKTKDIVLAIQLGIANSSANLTRLGAKDGLLSKTQAYKKIKVTKEKI
jgi:sugar/nucleoside kinase (ribokinase family)